MNRANLRNFVSNTMAAYESIFRVGDNVRLHPALDLFMRGVTSGRIVRVGYKFVTIESTCAVATGRRFRFNHATAVECLNFDGEGEGS